MAAFAALLVYGVWAAFVNLEHGAAMAFKAGLGQGIYAFVATWLITDSARRLLRRFGASRVGLTLSFLLSCCVMLALPLVLHSILGTINVWQAILPGLLWGMGYIAVVLYLDLKALQVSRTQ